MRREKWRTLRVSVELKVPMDSPLKDSDLRSAVERTLKDAEALLDRNLEGFRDPRPTHTRFRVKRSIKP